MTSGWIVRNKFYSLPVIDWSVTLNTFLVNTWPLLSFLNIIARTLSFHSLFWIWNPSKFSWAVFLQILNELKWLLSSRVFCLSTAAKLEMVLGARSKLLNPDVAHSSSSEYLAPVNQSCFCSEQDQSVCEYWARYNKLVCWLIFSANHCNQS